MNIEQVREYCLAKREVTESLPFNDTALVFKVAGKMFALLDLSEDKRGIALKCEPEKALKLRELYPEVKPAYHFNKMHWNGVSLNGSLKPEKIKEWIDDSYVLVVNSLPKKKKEELL